MKTRRHSKSHGGGFFSPSVNEYGLAEPSWWDKIKNKFSGYQSQSTIPAMTGGKSSRKGGRKIRGGKSKKSRKSKGGKRTRKHCKY